MTTKTPVNYSWPDEVSVLKREDLLWAWENRSGQADLQYWLSRVFNPSDRPSCPEVDEASRVLCQVLSERCGSKVTDLWRFLESAAKHKYPSLAFQARCWNEMLDRLGYDIEVELREATE